MKIRTQYALIALAMGHLALVATGAAYVEIGDLGPLSGPLAAYTTLSGANRTYGFFAPGVGSQVRARFEVVDGDGRSSEFSLLDGSSHEADLRVSNIINQFLNIGDELDDSDPEEQDDLRRAFAASLAGTFFGRHPEAQEVVVHLDEYEPVPRVEFLAGQRSDWHEIYTARFRHDGPTTAEETAL